ncbi:MAG: M50 family metallopeptidase [Myxococcales bacterium]|nr:M50 family metallopeptidase [Myxococcales bacterium]
MHSKSERAPEDDAPVTTPRQALLGALAASVIIGNFVPFGSIALYPFTLMATWVHEMGHGIAALAVGGAFERLDVFADASGLAHTRYQPGARGGVVAIAGMLAPPLIGAITLGFARGPRRARIALAVLSLAMLASCVSWVRSIAGWIAVPLVALALGAFARWGSPRERMICAQFVGLRLAVDTVTRIDYAFTSEAVIDGVRRTSDVAAITASWGAILPVWSLVIALTSFALVALGLWAAWRAPKRAKDQR